MIEISVEFVVFGMTTTFLLVASWFDMKKGEVEEWLWWSILGVGFISSFFVDMIRYIEAAGLMFSLGVLLNAAYNKKWIGGADIKAILCVIPSLVLFTWFTPFSFILNVIAFWGIQSLVHWILSKVKKTSVNTFPAIPLITVAYIYTVLFGTFI
jgi:hypothetical protein